MEEGDFGLVNRFFFGVAKNNDRTLKLQQVVSLCIIFATWPSPWVAHGDFGCEDPLFVLDFWGFGVGMGFEPIFCL